MSVDRPVGSAPNPGAPSRPRGRPFQKGNGGRKPGSKNKTTLVAAALLEGEEAEFVQTAKELAKAGNVPMLKFFLDRILPKERSVRIELPSMNGKGSAADSLGAIIDAVCVGQITPGEATALENLIMAHARIVNDAEVKLRLDALEERQKLIQQALEKLPKQI
jgi:hypothetical protein